MKKAILGQIIEENSHLNQLIQRLKNLEFQMRSVIDQGAKISINAEIEEVKKQLSENGSDQKRAELIKKIENITGRRLLTYFSIHGSISDRDARIIEDFLLSNNINKVDILIDSPGGFTDSAEKMIKICRIRTGNDEVFDFRTIISNQAKSAATLFALGSSKILMCKSAELGPVDPQILVYAPNGDKIRDSAHQIFYGSQKYQEKANKLFKFFNNGDLLLLSKYDPIAIKRAEVAIKHTNDIIHKRIYTNPHLKKNYGNKEDDIKRDLELFTEHEISYSHGRPIYFEDISEFGYCRNKFIQKLDEHFLIDEKKESGQVATLENMLWELTIRSLEVVRPSSEPIQDNNGNIIGFNQVAVKLFESSNGLILTKDIIN